MLDDPQFEKLCQAVRESDLGKVRSLYKGVDVNQKMNTWDMRSPLQFSIDSADFAIFEFLLLTCKADASFVDDKRRNALHHAVVEGQEEMFDVLLEQGQLDLLAEDAWSQTALHLAAHCSNIHMAQKLVERCPLALKREASDGRTPLEVALFRDNPKMKTFLQKQTSSSDGSNAKPPKSQQPTPVVSAASADGSLKKRIASIRSFASRSGSGSSSSRQKLLEKQVNELKCENEQLKHQLNESKATTTPSESATYAEHLESPAHLSTPLRQFLQQWREQERAHEEAMRHHAANLDVPNMLADMTTRLDHGRTLPRHQLDAHRKALMPATGIVSIERALSNIEDEFPVAHDEVSTACAMLESIGTRGLLSSVVRVPKELVEYMEVVQRLTTETLHELYASDRSDAVEKAVDDSLKLRMRCQRLEDELRELTATDVADKYEDVADCERRLRKAYGEAIEAANHVVLACDTSEYEQLRRHLDSAHEEGRMATTKVRRTQEHGCRDIDNDITVLETRTEEMQQELERAKEEICDEEALAVAAEQKEEEAANEVAAKLEELLKGELERKSRLEVIQMERCTREHKLSELEETNKKLKRVSKESREDLEVLSSVREQASKAAKELYTLVEFTVTASGKKFSDRRKRQTETSETARTQFLHERTEYERLATASITRLERALDDIREDIEYNERARKRSSGRTCLRKTKDFHAVIEELQDEYEQLSNQLEQEESERLEQLKKIEDVRNSMGIVMKDK